MVRCEVLLLGGGTSRRGRASLRNEAFVLWPRRGLGVWPRRRTAA